MAKLALRLAMRLSRDLMSSAVMASTAAGRAVRFRAKSHGWPPTILMWITVTGFAPGRP